LHGKVKELLILHALALTSATK